MSNVLVLNASYEHHQVVPFKHAIRMLARKVAVVHEADPGWIGPYPRPRVVRLVRYIYAKWKQHQHPRYFSKEGVHQRDGRSCAYCLGKASTIDHVLPKSRGGRTSWLNCVSACGDCNHDKGHMTPEEAGMPLLLEPWDPTPRGRRA